MGLITDFDFSKPKNNKYSQFVILFSTIIFGWILISRWSHFLDVLFFSFLNLRRNSLVHAFMTAFVLTVLFFVLVYCMNERQPDVFE